MRIGGGRVTNHPPSRRAGQANPPRHQDRACDHSIVAVRAARNMPSAGPSARPSGRRPSEPRHEAGCNAPQRIHRAASKGWAKKPNKIVRATYQSSPCVRPIGRRNTVEPTNKTSKSTRTANKHQEDTSEYRKDWNSETTSKGAWHPPLRDRQPVYIGPRRCSRNKGCQGRGREFKGCRRRMMAGERGQRVLKAPSPERYQWSPKGCARYGISTGHRGPPER